MLVNPRSKKLLAWSTLISTSSLLLSSISGLGPTSTALAQVNNADLACYLNSPDGQQYDLSALCGGFTGAATAIPTPSITLQTGDVQVTLRWDTDTDLDLYVRDPAGDEVSFFNPAVPSGGQLDVDANAGCFQRMENPVENIFWPTGEGMSGDYEVIIEVFKSCTDQRPTNFILDILTHGEVETHTGTLASEQERASFPFNLSDSAASNEPTAIEGFNRLPGIPGN